MFQECAPKSGCSLTQPHVLTLAGIHLEFCNHGVPNSCCHRSDNSVYRFFPSLSDSVCPRLGAWQAKCSGRNSNVQLLSKGKRRAGLGGGSVRFPCTSLTAFKPKRGLEQRHPVTGVPLSHGWGHCERCPASAQK